MAFSSRDVELGLQESDRREDRDDVENTTTTASTRKDGQNTLGIEGINENTVSEKSENTATSIPPKKEDPDNLHRTSTHRSRIPKPNLSAIARTITARSNASLLDPGPPPDGGVKAWTQACMGHLVILNTWGMVATFGVFQTYYTQELGLEPSAVSWIGSMQMLGHFGLGMWRFIYLDISM